MKFKTFLEAFTDWSKVKSDIDQSVQSIQKAIDKLREQRKANIEEIERLREEKKREKDSSKQEKINKKIKQLKSDNEKIGEQENELIKARKEAEEKSSQDKSSSSGKEDTPEEPDSTKDAEKDSKVDDPNAPELPDVEDVPLKKMSKSDIRKLIAYYEKLNDYLEYKRVRTKGKESFAVAERLTTVQDEIKDLNGELNRRK